MNQGAKLTRTCLKQISEISLTFCSVWSDLLILMMRLLNLSSSCNNTTVVGGMSKPYFFLILSISYSGGNLARTSLAIFRWTPPCWFLTQNPLFGAGAPPDGSTCPWLLRCSIQSQHLDEDQRLQGCWHEAKTQYNLKILRYDEPRWIWIYDLWFLMFAMKQLKPLCY